MLQLRAAHARRFCARGEEQSNFNSISLFSTNPGRRNFGPHLHKYLTVGCNNCDNRFIFASMTRQICDTITYRGEVFSLNKEILKSFFWKNPQKKPRSKSDLTALWRGYIATFEIIESELFVKKIETFADTNLRLKEVTNKVFPGLRKLDWYSGLLLLGNSVGRYYDEDPTANFVLLEIQNGDLTNSRRLDYKELSELKKELFNNFKLTDKYNKFFAGLKATMPDMTEYEIDQVLEHGILDTQ
jgi:hypothetical protein